MGENLTPFNTARQKAFNSLNNTLNALYGQRNVSEKDFKNEWLRNLSMKIVIGNS